MAICPSCSADNADTSRFCSECGAALAQTVTHASPAEEARAHALPSDSSHHGQFLPGTKVADRYRIVSLVGKGGMGEVYRADDLKLGQTVALKFLPNDFADDPNRLEYFHREVSLTRQITHPHVCRVHDIGEVDGQLFLSMEYIDGEDLRVLLRRIGRLPHDKGVQIAQQLCAGLAAAHAQGVLHRDLKPANIMIDGRGHVRITDFGLAKLTEEGTQGEVSGTPAYMAPEQLTRGETTPQSDLYSLGLILFEVFTGQAVHRTTSIAELKRVHEESSSSRPSDVVEDIDPSVERVILHCLEKQPEARPKSAQAVSAALPGGDPLAAALAAGETPSPEMVGAAGEAGVLSLKVGTGLFVVLFLMLVAIPLLADWRSDFQLNRLALKPDVFESKAQATIRDLGWSAPSITNVYGFQLDKNKESLEFWYRQSSHPLVPEMPSLTLHPVAWRVTWRNPAPLAPGMIGVRLDPAGNLIEFLAVPEGPVPIPLRQDNTNSSASDWEKKIFPLASLEPANFENCRSSGTPVKASIPVYADDVIVWRQRGSAKPRDQVVVATSAGRPVYFLRSTFESKNSQVSPTKRELGSIFFISLVFFAGLLALRHLRMGRADTKGALRCSLYFFAFDMILWMLALHHDGSSARELQLARSYLVRSLAYALRIWLYYVAFEPLIRRLWPDMLISWSRLLSGRYRDALVGRDILVGCLWGTVMALLLLSFDETHILHPNTILGGRFVAAEILNQHQLAIISGLAYLTYLLMARVLFRRTWLALAGFALILTLSWSNFEDPKTLAEVVWFASLGVLLVRGGLLCTIAGVFAYHVLISFAYGAVPEWYSHAGYFALASVLLVGCYGFYTSTLAGRSLVGDGLLGTESQ